MLSLKCCAIGAMAKIFRGADRNTTMELILNSAVVEMQGTSQLVDDIHPAFKRLINEVTAKEFSEIEKRAAILKSVECIDRIQKEYTKVRDAVIEGQGPLDSMAKAKATILQSLKANGLASTDTNLNKNVLRAFQEQYHVSKVSELSEYDVHKLDSNQDEFFATLNQATTLSIEDHKKIMRSDLVAIHQKAKHLPEEEREFRRGAAREMAISRLRIILEDEEDQKLATSSLIEKHSESGMPDVPAEMKSALIAKDLVDSWIMHAEKAEEATMELGVTDVLPEEQGTMNVDNDVNSYENLHNIGILATGNSGPGAHEEEYARWSFTVIVNGNPVPCENAAQNDCQKVLACAKAVIKEQGETLPHHDDENLTNEVAAYIVQNAELDAQRSMEFPLSRVWGQVMQDRLVESATTFFQTLDQMKEKIKSEEGFQEGELPDEMVRLIDEAENSNDLQIKKAALALPIQLLGDLMHIINNDPSFRNDGTLANARALFEILSKLTEDQKGNRYKLMDEFVLVLWHKNKENGLEGDYPKWELVKSELDAYLRQDVSYPPHCHRDLSDILLENPFMVQSFAQKANPEKAELTTAELQKSIAEIYSMNPRHVILESTRGEFDSVSFEETPRPGSVPKDTVSVRFATGGQWCVSSSRVRSGFQREDINMDSLSNGYASSFMQNEGQQPQREKTGVLKMLGQLLVAGVFVGVTFICEYVIMPILQGIQFLFDVLLGLVCLLMNTTKNGLLYAWNNHFGLGALASAGFFLFKWTAKLFVCFLSSLWVLTKPPNGSGPQGQLWTAIGLFANRWLGRFIGNLLDLKCWWNGLRLGQALLQDMLNIVARISVLSILLIVGVAGAAVSGLVFVTGAVGDLLIFFGWLIKLFVSLVYNHGIGFVKTMLRWAGRILLAVLSIVGWLFSQVLLRAVMWSLMSFGVWLLSYLLPMIGGFLTYGMKHIAAVVIQLIGLALGGVSKTFFNLLAAIEHTGKLIFEKSTILYNNRIVRTNATMLRHQFHRRMKIQYQNAVASLRHTVTPCVTSDDCRVSIRTGAVTEGAVCLNGGCQTICDIHGQCPAFGYHCQAIHSDEQKKLSGTFHPKKNLSMRLNRRYQITSNYLSTAMANNGLRMSRWNAQAGKQTAWASHFFDNDGGEALRKEIRDYEKEINDATDGITTKNAEYNQGVKTTNEQFDLKLKNGFCQPATNEKTSTLGFRQHSMKVFAPMKAMFTREELYEGLFRRIEDDELDQISTIPMHSERIRWLEDSMKEDHEKFAHIAISYDKVSPTSPTPQRHNLPRKNVPASNWAGRPFKIKALKDGQNTEQDDAYGVFCEISETDVGQKIKYSAINNLHSLKTAIEAVGVTSRTRSALASCTDEITLDHSLTYELVAFRTQEQKPNSATHYEWVDVFKLANDQARLDLYGDAQITKIRGNVISYSQNEGVDVCIAFSVGVDGSASWPSKIPGRIATVEELRVYLSARFEKNPRFYEDRPSFQTPIESADAATLQQMKIDLWNVEHENYAHTFVQWDNRPDVEAEVVCIDEKEPKTFKIVPKKFLRKKQGILNYNESALQLYTDMWHATWTREFERQFEKWVATVPSFQDFTGTTGFKVQKQKVVEFQYDKSLNSGVLASGVDYWLLYATLKIPKDRIQNLLETLVDKDVSHSSVAPLEESKYLLKYKGNSDSPEEPEFYMANLKDDDIVGPLPQRKAWWYGAKTRVFVPLDSDEMDCILKVPSGQASEGLTLQAYAPRGTGLRATYGVDGEEWTIYKKRTWRPTLEWKRYSKTKRQHGETTGFFREFFGFAGAVEDLQSRDTGIGRQNFNHWVSTSKIANTWSQVETFLHDKLWKMYDYLDYAQTAMQSLSTATTEAQLARCIDEIGSYAPAAALAEAKAKLASIEHRWDKLLGWMTKDQAKAELRRLVHQKDNDLLERLSNADEHFPNWQASDFEEKYWKAMKKTDQMVDAPGEHTQTQKLTWDYATAPVLELLHLNSPVISSQKLLNLVNEKKNDSKVIVQILTQSGQTLDLNSDEELRKRMFPLEVTYGEYWYCFEGSANLIRKGLTWYEKTASVFWSFLPPPSRNTLPDVTVNIMSEWGDQLLRDFKMPYHTTPNEVAKQVKDLIGLSEEYFSLFYNWRFYGLQGEGWDERNLRNEYNIYRASYSGNLDLTVKLRSLVAIQHTNRYLDWWQYSSGLHKKNYNLAISEAKTVVQPSSVDPIETWSPLVDKKHQARLMIPCMAKTAAGQLEVYLATSQKFSWTANSIEGSSEADNALREVFDHKLSGQGMMKGYFNTAKRIKQLKTSIAATLRAAGGFWTDIDMLEFNDKQTTIQKFGESMGKSVYSIGGFKQGQASPSTKPLILTGFSIKTMATCTIRAGPDHRAAQRLPDSDPMAGRNAMAAQATAAAPGAAGPQPLAPTTQ